MQEFVCQICGSITWESVYKKRVMHPLWWLSKANIYMDLNHVICQQCGYITLFPRLDYADYETYYKKVPAP